VALDSQETKKCLINLKSMYLLEKQMTLRHEKTLYVVWEMAKSVCFGVLSDCKELLSMHEEADVIIPFQVNDAIKKGNVRIQVQSEDTDVFCLLLHYYHNQSWEVELSMWSKHWCIDIAKSACKHADLLDKDILNLHALSGCDTVPMMFGVGKKKSLENYKISPVPSLHQQDQAIATEEAKTFVAQCYSTKKIKCRVDSSDNRSLLWNHRSKTGQKPHLKSLPPTNEALELNIQRARFQSIIWHAALDLIPPQIEATNHGWKSEDHTKTLSPVMLPDGTDIAPEEVLRMTKCSCMQSKCDTNACGCKKNGLKCSEFCQCENCYNCEKPISNSTNDMT
jgi:hypothetical protein